MSEKKYPIKWEYKSHSYPIGDTGDYDGYWEVTNGKDSLITKEDYEDIEKDLQAVVDLLNNTYANFTFDRNIEAALEAENKWLKSELEQHKAETCAVWVKASDRLPEKEHNYHVKATAHFQGYNHNDTALWRNNKWEFDSDNGRIVVEWLDESGCEAKKALEGTLKELIALINEKAKYGIPVDLAVGTKAGAMCIEIEELTRKALEG